MGMFGDSPCHEETGGAKDHESDSMYRPLGTFWRAARVGERLSPYVSLCCVAMAVSWFGTLL